MRRAIGSALLTAAALLVSLVFVEVTLRIYGRSAGPLAVAVRTWDPYLVKVEPHGQFGYRPRPDAAFMYGIGVTAHENQMSYRGPMVAVAKPLGTIRVVLLGESTTHGFGVRDSETIDRYLEPLLRDSLKGRPVQVINLAFDGYDAYQIWQRLLSDGIRLQPDAIVLNTGINDVRNARYRDLADPDPRTLIWEGEMRRLRWEADHGGPSLYTRLKHYLYIARLPGSVRALLASKKSRAQPRENVYPDAAAMFSRNVERIADQAKGLGIPLLLSTPPSILLKTGGPVMLPRSYWVVDAATTQTYRDTLAARLGRIAAERAADGVRYEVHDLPVTDFLDDCHLTPAGNRAMAADFARALVPLLRGNTR